MRLRSIVIVAGVLHGLLVAPPVFGQGTTIGTFRWQLQPYCNVVTVAVIQLGGQYEVEGTDDHCGAPRRGSVVGLAFPNPDGSIGFGLTLVTVPSGAGVHVDATISLATLSGTWRDSEGLTGAFVLTPGAGVAGAPRPLPPDKVNRPAGSGRVIVPGAAFHAGDVAGGLGYNFIQGYRSTSISPNTCAIASVHLPDGVTITRVDAYVSDSSTDSVNMFLRRSPASFANQQTMASVPASTGTSGQQVLTATAIDSPLVDTDNFAYVLDTCNLDASALIFKVVITFNYP